MASELPPGWTHVPFGECGRWLSGGTPRTSEAHYWGGDIPWISAKSLQTFRIRDSDRRVTPLGVENGTRLVPEGSLLFVVRGMSLKTEFRLGIAKREVAFGQDCKAVIPRAGIDPDFLGYAVAGRHADILGLADSASHGTGRLATAPLKALKIAMPQLTEQRGIAEILGSLDDRIEHLARRQHLLTELADSLFEELLITAPDRALLGDWITLDKGVSYSGEHLEEVGAGVPMVNLGNFGRGRLPRWDNTKAYSGVTKSPHQAPPGTVVICATDMTSDRVVLGKALEVPMDLLGACATHHLYIVRQAEPHAFRQLVTLLALNHEPTRDAMSQYANGTTVLSLPKDAVLRLAVPHLADESEQRAFVDGVRPLLDGVRAAHLETETLNETRRVLLPELVSGRMQIAEVDEFLARAEIAA